MKRCCFDYNRGKKVIRLHIVLAAKKFARKYFNKQPYYIGFRGNIGKWTYFVIKRKGLPRYTGFGALIRVFNNGKVDKNTYFVPQRMWHRPLKDTAHNREWISLIIKDDKKREEIHPMPPQKKLKNEG